MMTVPNFHLRKARRLILSAKLWRKRLVFWCGALLIGVAASYFAEAVDFARDVFDRFLRPHPFLPLIITPLAFAIVAALTRRYIPAARGSGIPQAIAARVMRDPVSRNNLLGPKVIIGKALLTLIVIMAGASVGREGPTVQIGAGILLFFASLSGMSSQRGVVLAGAAAGVAAAFNTPLAGIVFAIEEMARAFEHRNSTIVLIAIVLAGAASMSILGNYDYFGYTTNSLSFPADWLPILVLGILGGITGGLFARMLIYGEPFLRQRYNRLGHRRPALFAGMCGLMVALLGLVTHGLTYGTGYEMGYGLLHGSVTPEWWQMPAKLASTAFSAICGIPGGIFSPSLSVGSAFGADMSQFFPNTAFQGVVLLGMVAYFAGVTQAPITAFVIVLEITGKGNEAVPLIATAVIASTIGRILCPTSLYHALAKTFIIPKSSPKVVPCPLGSAR